LKLKTRLQPHLLGAMLTVATLNYEFCVASEAKFGKFARIELVGQTAPLEESESAHALDHFVGSVG